MARKVNDRAAPCATPPLIKNIQHSSPREGAAGARVSEAEANLGSLDMVIVTEAGGWGVLVGGQCCYAALLFRCCVCSGFTWYS